MGKTLELLHTVVVVSNREGRRECGLLSDECRRSVVMVECNRQEPKRRHAVPGMAVARLSTRWLKQTAVVDGRDVILFLCNVHLYSMNGIMTISSSLY